MCEYWRPRFFREFFVFSTLLILGDNECGILLFRYVDAFWVIKRFCMVSYPHSHLNPTTSLSLTSKVWMCDALQFVWCLCIFQVKARSSSVKDWIVFALKRYHMAYVTKASQEPNIIKSNIFFHQCFELFLWSTQIQYVYFRTYYIQGYSMLSDI